MANGLTGEFDVVVEVATGAVNRVLAAMHACERFPHSMSVRVDDTIPPGKGPRPTLVGAVDLFGEPVVNHKQIGNPIPFGGVTVATNAVFAGLDILVNGGLVAYLPPTVPSLLQGHAQLQLFPPTIDVSGSSASGNITVRQTLMARYFPDKNTAPLAEFVRGELQITAAVNQVASQAANVIDIDFKADQAAINFSPSSSSTPLSAEDLAAINLVIRNGLRTGFLPSNATLPPQIAAAQFKALPGAESAVGLLLNMAPGTARGNPGSMNHVFLAGSDFAYAAGADFIQRALQLSRVRDHRNSYYDFDVTPTLTLEDGRILLTLAVHATGKHWYTPDLSGTVKQAFTLKLVPAKPGDPLNTAELALEGDISVEVDDLPDFVADPFKDSLRTMRNEMVAAQQPAVRDMLNIEKSLGTVLRSLLSPAQPKPGDPPQQVVQFVLAYASVQIQASGITLRGSVSVSNWPAAHIEYQQIPSTTGGPQDVAFHPPDYSALKTWIPGGTIDRYEWAPNGTNFPLTVESDKFVLLEAGILSPDTPGYSPLCLAIGGWRLSSSGPVVKQPFSATVCGYRFFPVLSGLAAVEAGKAMVALTQPGPQGGVQVTGHTAARGDLSGRSTPNLIVHFGDDKTSGKLEHLTRALRESGRKDAQTAIVAVLSAEQIARAQYTPGVIYAENHDGAWNRAYGAKAGKPQTLIVIPGGKTVWHHEGDIEEKALAAALHKFLVSGATAGHSVVGMNVRLGRSAPNFLFALASGQGLTLRKMKGQPAVLVFWRSTSRASIEAVYAWQKNAGKTALLAINDGEDAGLAKRVAEEHKFTANLVTDPKREISQAYGVNLWPTSVLLNAGGLVTSIRYGHAASEAGKPSAGGKSAA